MYLRGLGFNYTFRRGALFTSVAVALHFNPGFNIWSLRWLRIQAEIGLAQNTVDAYGRGLEELKSS